MINPLRKCFTFVHGRQGDTIQIYSPHTTPSQVLQDLFDKKPTEEENSSSAQGRERMLAEKSLLNNPSIL